MMGGHVEDDPRRAQHHPVTRPHTMCMYMCMCMCMCMSHVLHMSTHAHAHAQVLAQRLQPTSALLDALDEEWATELVGAMRSPGSSPTGEC